MADGNLPAVSLSPMLLLSVPLDLCLPAWTAFFPDVSNHDAQRLGTAALVSVTRSPPIRAALRLPSTSLPLFELVRFTRRSGSNQQTHNDPRRVNHDQHQRN